MKKITILGSTGSIGTQTLEIIRQFPENFKVSALTAGKNIELFRKQLAEFKPSFAAMEKLEDVKTLSKEFPKISFGVGMNGITVAASMIDSDLVVNSLLGMLGIRPTYEAIKSKKNIAFANKETLVAAGKLIMQAVKDEQVAFLPVDSEHSAIFQSLQGSAENPVYKLLLTASGGPFRSYSYQQLKNVTLKQALKHPNWTMGAKITIDSATMMNKGLEIMEASHLFDIPAEKIEVLVHPESALHSAVEFEDGSIIGQMGAADMKLPIAYALSYPKRLKNPGKKLDLTALSTLHFERPDLESFRCLKLAYEAIALGKSYPACLNAANEEAVSAFLQEKLSFVQIAEVVEECLQRHKAFDFSNLDEIEEMEKMVKNMAKEIIERTV